MKTAKKEKPLVAQAYELLKYKMISLELPPGMKIEEQKLIDLLKMGRTPIREALKMLISEGPIVSYGTNAIYVKDLTLKSSRDSRLMINHLNMIAIDLANHNSDFTDIITELKSSKRIMDKSLDKDDIQAYIMANAEFHKTLAKIADNEYLYDIVERLYFFETRQAFVISLSFSDTEKPKFTDFYQTCQKHHIKFIEYLENKDFEKLKMVYKDHFIAAQERISDYLSK